MRSSKVGMLILAASLLVSAPVAAGTILTFGFTGTVSVADFNRGLFGPLGTVMAGDSFSGHFSYEIGPGNPDQLPGDPDRGAYDIIDLVIDGSTVPLTPAGFGIIRQTSVIPPATAFYRFFIVADAPVYGQVTLGLQGPASIFPDDALPTMLDLADFTDVAAIGGPSNIIPDPDNPPNVDTGLFDSISLTGVVVEMPEPRGISAVALAAGLLFFAVTRRARATALRRCR